MTTPLYMRKGQTPDYTGIAAPQSDITLYGMAEQLLARCGQAFFERGVELPGRQIIYLAPLPVDCEQVAVLISGYVPTPLWETTMVCSQVRWMGTFDVVVSRCSPAIPKGNKAPSPAQMMQSARIASEDAESLLRMVQGLEEIGAEFQLEMGAPQGGFQTTVAHVQLPSFGGMD